MREFARLSSGKQMGKIQLRVQVPKGLDTLVRMIAPFLNTGQMWTPAEVVTDALVLWLKQPQNQALIKRHKINERLKELLTKSEQEELAALFQAEVEE
ncbi:hypothetical protein K9N68_38440 (plasmid) [Kovacikia minuta CCNUW1]|uniref:hypothetical protein n=1 Tax=Kovacikia minuta TaxID=2931930 RepID=UPI001CD023AE|nr:hypothetical protein [Kovacikia minuta]UBF30069.1 hypothetical protein K9N68_38440 [Kovacikia minuta CCNUW1]